jgi:acyl dehydratase
MRRDFSGTLITCQGSEAATGMRIRNLSARFVAPVFPNAELVTEIEEVGTLPTERSLNFNVASNGHRVINSGWTTLTRSFY